MPTTQNSPRSPKDNAKSKRSQQRKNNRSAAGQKPDEAQPQPPALGNSLQSESQSGTEAEVCFICAEPIKYHAVSACNHRTCHVCSLRLRALYKKMECTFCKESQETVIFTSSPDALFSSFSPESIQYKDSKLNIFFETQEMMDDTLLLLRFNCPDSDCDYIANGWGDLRLHVRATHGKLMCELCIRSKKVFAHEHALYSHNQLAVHLPSLTNRPQRNPPKDIEGGIHPYCEFCRESFFADDELYSHMRERHEDCFICKRNEIRDLYFQNYDSLEKHFNQAHFPCPQPTCLAQKFVVFNTAMDLKGHMMEAHRGEMTAKDRRDARRIEVDFEEASSGPHNRRGRREQEPPPSRPPQPHPPPQVSGGRRRVVFGSSLTGAEGSASPANAASPSPVPSGSRTLDSSGGDVDPALLERHANFVRRLETLAPNPVNAVPAVKAAIRGYRSNEASARDLISTIWNVLDHKLDHTASVVNAFVDLLEEDEKKEDLLASWKGFDIEQRRQFPDLVPTAAASSSARYAGIASGRVLNVKHTSGSRSSGQSSRQVWDRVAQAAGSSSQRTTPQPQNHFPPLQPGTGPTSKPPPVNKTPRWNSNVTRDSAPDQYPPIGGSKMTPGRTTPARPAQPAKLSKDAFPELPSSNNARSKPQINGNSSLRNILGTGNTPAVAAWSKQSPKPDEANGSSAISPTPAGGSGGGKSKKGKGKMVYTLSSFQAG